LATLIPAGHKATHVGDVVMLHVPRSK
jgi:hypothetical protein